MDLHPAVLPHAEPAEVMQPRDGPFHDPAEFRHEEHKGAMQGPTRRREGAETCGELREDRGESQTAGPDNSGRPAAFVLETGSPARRGR